MKSSTKTKPAAALAARTPAQIKAQATLLTGEKSRAAAAITAADADDVQSSDTGTVGELWLYGVVGGWWRGFNAEGVAEALRGMDVDNLYVRLHSPGGLADDGIAIGNLLRNHKAKVTIVVDGLAASAASVIAVAGDEVVMCPGSRLMIHDVMWGAYGNAADIRLIAELLESQSNNYAGIYQYRAGGTEAEWREAMLANDGWGTFYTAAEAVTANLADEVGTRVAAGSPPTDASEDDWDDDSWAKAAHDVDLLEHYVHPAARAAWLGERPKPPSASAVGSTQPEGAAVVDLNDEQIASLREQVGFADDADADTIVQATLEALAERATEDGDPASPIAAVPEGMTVVSKTVFEDVTAKAEAGSKAATELLEMRTAAFLEKYKDRFPATTEARDKWAADYRRDPEATEKYLAASAVLVPTTEVGHGGDGENSPVAVAEDPGYKNWEL